MNAITFDTLKFARILQEQGHFTPEQSSSLVDAIGGVLAADIATRGDLRELELRLEARIAESEHGLQGKIAELKVDLANVKADLAKWLIGAVGIQTVVILGAVVALSRMAR